MPYQVRKMDSSFSGIFSTRTYAGNISDSLVLLLDIQIFPGAVLPYEIIKICLQPQTLYTMTEGEMV